MSQSLSKENNMEGRLAKTSDGDDDYSSSSSNNEESESCSSDGDSCHEEGDEESGVIAMKKGYNGLLIRGTIVGGVDKKLTATAKPIPMDLSLGDDEDSENDANDENVQAPMEEEAPSPPSIPKSAGEASVQGQALLSSNISSTNEETPVQGQPSNTTFSNKEPVQLQAPELSNATSAVKTKVPCCCGCEADAAGSVHKCAISGRKAIAFCLTSEDMGTGHTVACRTCNSTMPKSNITITPTSPLIGVSATTTSSAMVTVTMGPPTTNRVKHIIIPPVELEFFRNDPSMDKSYIGPTDPSGLLNLVKIAKSNKCPNKNFTMQIWGECV